MPSSQGISAETGMALSDWDHVQQSIGVILTTPIGSRIMRRDFGSDLPDLVDQKMTRKGILSVFSAAAIAIERWEPRFRMTSGRVTETGASGSIALALYGTYYPFGHRGDYSVAEDKVARIVVSNQ